MSKTAEQLRQELEKLMADQEEMLRKMQEKFKEEKRCKRRTISRVERKEERERIRNAKEEDHAIMIIFRDVFKGIEVSKSNAREVFEHLNAMMSDADK